MALDLDSATLITINGIECSDEGTKEKFARSDSQAVRILRCAWTDRLVLAGYLMGGSTEAAGIAITLNAGAIYPDFHQWIVKTVEIAGDGIMSVGGNGLVAYERAILTATYGPVQFDPGDPLLVGDEELEFSSTAIALSQDSSSFFWATGPNADKDIPNSMVPAVRITTISYTKTRYNVPILPVELVRSLVDHSNGTPFLGAAPETVVFRGGRSRRKITAGGVRNWDITYRFEENHRGWNNLLDGKNGFQAFLLRSPDADGNSKLFPDGDLNQLFA